jgi:6-phosphogluconolactonase
MALELIVDKPEALVATLARRFEDEARGVLQMRASASVVLTGGSVATMFFPALARTGVDWSRVDFFWGDERAVPPDDPESNFGAARRLWLEPAGVPADRTHRMPADTLDLDAAARAYEADLTAAIGAPARPDLVLLGAGPDGHVCSLFPGHAALAETTRQVLAVRDSPKPPPARLTLTLPVLTGAGLVVVAALGDSKAAAVREALQDPDSPLPLAQVVRRASRALVLLDSAAASLLAARP